MTIHARSLSGASLAGAAVAALVAAACDARIQLMEPRTAATGPAVLTVVAADTALAQRAGWDSGVPGVTVYLRQDQDPNVRTLQTDSTGRLSLGDLPAADYWIWAEKRPAGAELEAPALAPPALGGGLRITLQRSTMQMLPMHSQDNGALVISEFHYHDPPSWMPGMVGFGFWYYWYIELYNNADTTIYLDGKIIGAGFNYYIDGSLWSCAETSPFRNDPRGIWAQRFQAFPGSGHDYPVAPGKTVLIAEEAIDHSAITPGLPDLRNANFQFNFPGHAVNPAVPLMRPIQIRTAYSTMYYGLPEVAFVSMEVDIASLPRMQGKYTGGDFALFPRNAILDVAVLYSAGAVGPQTIAPYCRTIVDTSIDPLAAFVRPSGPYQGDSTHLLSAQRKLLPDGLHLQRTGVSADWEIRPRSPGKVP